jgi:type I restriction enzyme, S subunit
LVIGRKGTAGMTWLQEQPCWPSDTTFYLAWRKPDVDVRFLYHALQQYPLSGEHAKTTLPSLTKPDLENHSLPLPPLPEQRAIARVLRTVQRAREQTEAVIGATRQLKGSLLRHLFSYGPVPIDQAEQVSLKETEIGPVPEHWEVVHLGKKATIGNGSTPKRDNAAYWHGGTIPWLTSGKVHEGVIRHADHHVTERARSECHLPLVPAESLVVAITGQGKTLGNAALVTFDTSINQHLAYIRTKDSNLTPEFLLSYLGTRYEHLREVSRSGGSTKGALTCAFLRTYLIPLPPLDEQRLISTALATVSSKLEAEEARKRALDALFTTLLHDLMTARVRVHDLVLASPEPSEAP